MAKNKNAFTDNIVKIVQHQQIDDKEKLILLSRYINSVNLDREYERQKQEALYRWIGTAAKSAWEWFNRK